MIPEHFIWWGLTMGCVLWYCTITVYVAIRGFVDVRHLLRDLRDRDAGGKTGSPAATRHGEPDSPSVPPANPTTTKNTP